MRSLYCAGSSRPTTQFSERAILSLIFTEYSWRLVATIERAVELCYLQKSLNMSEQPTLKRDGTMEVTAQVNKALSFPPQAYFFSLASCPTVYLKNKKALLAS